MASDLPVITVVIHFLDAAKYLEEAVRSVLWQTFKEWELVFVDGGSNDGSQQIAERYVGRHGDRIRYLRHNESQPLGIFSSRIWGARQARCQLLAHLDSDDEWHPQFLERQYALHRHYFRSMPGMVYCPMTYWWQDADRAFDAYVQPVPPPGIYQPPSLITTFLANSYSFTPGNSAVMINRDILLSASQLMGVADEGAVEDQFLWSFVALRYPICVNPEPLTRYRQWPGSVCARTVAAGIHRERRLLHFEWLDEYLVSKYSGPDRDKLLSACRAESRNL